MNGAESLVHTLISGGVDTCFANPGTSEMHFVAALDRIPGMRCVLGLFEGVVTGAADGYGRMAGRPAATLLHCGPGLANGLANLHNARKAWTPMVNIVGDQATYHRPLDAPLTAATEDWARPVSCWARTVTTPQAVGAAAAEAIAAARTAPGGVATLILPSDASWSDGGVVAAALPVPAPPRVDEAAVARAAALLRAGGAALLLDGAALGEEALLLAHRIGAATGARLYANSFAPRLPRGPGRPVPARIPYAVDAAQAALADVRALVLVGAKPPATFFAYPGKRGVPQPEDCSVASLAAPGDDLLDALARLADLLRAPRVPAPAAIARPQPGRGRPSSAAFGQTLAALMPEEAVVVDEGITFSFAFGPATEGAPRHDWLQLTGGAIGVGLPLATGAAIGAPGRRVIGLQADGSALYTIQALWTQARENLDVTTVIFSNRAYAILKHEYANVGAVAGPTATAMMSLGEPDLDWVKLAEGFGVEAARAATLEAFADLFQAANRRRGPFLIELMLG
jgi:acetolactate synthase-1/2/3 large subunit